MKFGSPKRSGRARSQDAAYHRDSGHVSAGMTSRHALRNSSPNEVLWKRRGQTPEMDEYLTLTELENVWHTQDAYALCVCAPQSVAQYTFQEAVEVPLIAKHDIRRSPSLNAVQLEPSRSHLLFQLNVQDDSTVINGAVHPALRPSPYLSDEQLPTYKSSPPRLAISVPNTSWTYGGT